MKNNPFFRITNNYTEFPFITIAPQCNKDTWFDHFMDLKELVLSVLELDCVDSNMIYAMGASMGGYAVWQLEVVKIVFSSNCITPIIA